MGSVQVNQASVSHPRFSCKALFILPNPKNSLT